MKTKKFLWSVLAVLAIGLSCMSLTSCSGDDNGVDEHIYDQVVGTWVDYYSDGDQSILVFYGNGTGKKIERYYVPGLGYEDETYTFNYTMTSATSGTFIEFDTDPKDTCVYTFTISGTQMNITGVWGDGETRTSVFQKQY